jgi:hypothetical protein
MSNAGFGTQDEPLSVSDSGLEIAESLDKSQRLAAGARIGGRTWTGSEASSRVRLSGLADVCWDRILGWASPGACAKDRALLHGRGARQI